ncbi:MAG: hypothetical protein WC855_13335 [Thermodesulfovibrionales bacterium]
MTLRTVSLILVAVFFTASYQVHANEKLSGQEVLATAKIAGACGILDSMIIFQKTTKMEGGDKFVSRFWAVEAARRGISVQQMSKQCDGAVTLYDKLWKSMESKSQ